MRALLSIFILACIGLTAAALLIRNGDEEVRSSLSVAEALAGDTTGYSRANRPRAFTFPEDHGPHPDFRTEWWYYTGNLASDDGRHFGYQLTIFRTALRPKSTQDSSAFGAADAARVDRRVPENGLMHGVDGGAHSAATNSEDGPSSDSTWRTRQVYMAHFALSASASAEFYSAERFSRGAAGLAGAQAQPYRVWLENWSVSGSSADTVTLRARDGAFGLDVALTRAKPIVLQGDAGLDAKGPEPGNASYYYSMTRMETDGRIMFGGDTVAVSGLSWMDREWSTSALGADQVGWDWFALQLDSGTDVMYYRLRERDGSSSPYSGGVVVAQDGSTTRIGPEDLRLTSIDHWTSPETGNRYPVEWSLEIPSQAMQLRITPHVQDQELVHSVTYWEGAVRVSGTDQGSGFVELTGYGESPLPL